MKKVIIVGSSRRNGDTEKAAKAIIKHTDWAIINLSDYNISYYDYEHQNRTDDYIPLMQKIISTYDVLIFATPVLLVFHEWNNESIF